MRYFCTYFDSNYATRGLAMYESLRRHFEDFELTILCLDDACRQRLARLALPGCRLISLPDLEAADPDLLLVKGTRSTSEYYFTLTPCLVRYLLPQTPEGEFLTYLDSDLYFFSSPKALFGELENGSIGIISHRFPPEFAYMEQHGIYNVGWVSFRTDEQGRACNDWWRDRCLEWCYDRVEDGRYADQAYLNEWPRRFPGVVVIQHLGANVAPWNVGQYKIASDGSAVTVDGRDLIFYHFHALRKVADRLFDAQLSKYGVNMTGELRQHIYTPYLEELSRAEQRLHVSHLDESQGEAEPTSSESGFELIPRASEPNAKGLIEEKSVEEYLYRNLVLSERDRCLKQTVVLGLMEEIKSLNSRILFREQSPFKWALESAARLAGDAKSNVVARLANNCWTQMGILRQHEPRKMRVERFPRPSQPESKWPSMVIVTPSFMQGAFLERTIKSVLTQDYPKLSYIIQDGGSKDNSAEIIKAYESRLARWESAPDGGQSDAIKRGFQDRDEDIMAWLNSDDMLMPGALAFVGDYFAANPSVDVIYGHRVIINENDDEVGRWVLPKHEKEILKWADYVPQETLFWRRKLWDEVGGVDTSFHFAIDWDLLLKFERASARIVRLPHFLGCFRMHSQQKTSSKMTNSTGDREMARIRARIHGRIISASELSPHVAQFRSRAAKAAFLLSIGIRK